MVERKKVIENEKENKKEWKLSDYLREDVEPVDVPPHGGMEKTAKSWIKQLKNEFEFLEDIFACQGHENSFWDSPYIILIFDDIKYEIGFWTLLYDTLKTIDSDIGADMGKMIIRVGFEGNIIFEERRENKYLIRIFHLGEDLKKARSELFKFVRWLLSRTKEALGEYPYNLYMKAEEEAELEDTNEEGE